MNPIIIEEMGAYYKELSIYKELISKTVETEESKFLIQQAYKKDFELFNYKM